MTARGLDAEGRSLDFPRLVVKARDEIVSFGVPDEVVVDEQGIVGGGTRLRPDELDALVAERGDDVVLFDGRNAVEAQVGRFRGAVVPDIRHTSDFVRELDAGRWDELKGRPVVTYCTGGIRCEVLTSLMRSRGFEEVYQLDGGIVRYGEERGDRGLWEGHLYVFDERMSVPFSDEAVHLAACHVCGDADEPDAQPRGPAGSSAPARLRRARLSVPRDTPPRPVPAPPCGACCAGRGSGVLLARAVVPRSASATGPRVRACARRPSRARRDDRCRRARAGP